MEENQRRARERAQEQVVQQAHLYSSRSSTASISSNSSLTNYPGQFIQLPGARAQPPGTLHGLGDSFDKGGWIADPTLLPTPDGEIPAYASEYLDMSCTCNTLTGPCVQHCEEMRVQFLGFLSSAQNEPAPLGGGMGGGGASSSSSGAGSVNSAGGAKSVFPGLMGDAHLRKLMQLQQIDPSLHSPPLHSPPVFPDMHQQQHHYQNTSSPFGQQRPPPPPTTTTTTTSNATTLSSPGSTSPCLLPERRSSSPGPNAAKSNNSSNSSSNIHAHINHNTNNSNNNNNNNHSNTSRTRSAATNTSRFKSILTFVRAAGFPDFDSMVASYYTSNFQRNSVADLAQRSSRGRRLGGVLNSLRESAAGWTVWESRQYRESIVEAAQGMYAKELEVVLQRARKTRQRQRQQQQAQPAYLTSPQEQHEQKHQQQQQQTQQTQQQQQEEEEQDTPMFGTGTFPEVPTSSATVISSLLSGLAMPEEMGRVFQDNVSYSGLFGQNTIGSDADFCPPPPSSPTSGLSSPSSPARRACSATAWRWRRSCSCTTPARTRKWTWTKRSPTGTAARPAPRKNSGGVVRRSGYLATRQI